ncbi:TIR domain-containing protein [Saccharothrix syringae]|uniref:TIR domain-containing protein n=1 Tax=Saccharothrix syringae TaxID=103733 RepID=A0A5Q0H064_SACSY|nr:TIR domain-containing protein [Saccharothrix syringae]QFZ19579.1 TIR domain-containing protein [Saccharothrix syringae]
MPVESSEPQGYDAFISYNHGADDGTAARLQRLIRRVGRPWYERSVLRIYRDETNSLMSESLWGSIEQELRRSRHFILLASPGAAKSFWVRREVRFWRENRDRSTFFIMRVDGTISWQGKDFDLGADSNAVPPDLAGWFTSEPHWKDVAVTANGRRARRERAARVRDAALTIAASLYRVDKDELHDEDERQRRRARRRTVTAVALFSALVLTLGISAIVQGNKADSEARIALARKLAAASDSQLAANLDVANLLAVKAFRADPSPQTRGALFRAVTASGSLVRMLPFDADVVQLTASADGGTVVVGLRGGAVLRWRLADSVPELLLTLDDEPRSLSVSADGGTVIATDGDTSHLMRPGRPVESIPVRPGWEVRAVAVSLSGRTAVMSTGEKVYAGRAMTNVLALDGDVLRSVDHDQGGERPLAVDLITTSDEETFLIDSAYGQWERRRLADWSMLSGSSAGFGTANYGVTASADGRAFSYSNGADTFRVWSTDRPTEFDAPDLTANAPIKTPEAIELSANASYIAVAEDNTIYVAPVRQAGTPSAEPIRLTGTGTITRQGLRFLGTDGTKLVSASGNRVAVWDLAQTDRISHTFPIEVSAGCNACGPPDVAVSPDGSRLVVIDGSGWGGVAGPTAQPQDIRTLPNLGLPGRYGPAVWERDGSLATVLVQPPLGGTEVSVPDGWPVSVRGVPAGQRGEGVLSAALTADTRQVVVVEDDGGIELIDLSTAATRRVLPDPDAPPAPRAPRVQAAAISSTADLVAVADEDSVMIRAAHTGVTVGEIALRDVRYLVFVPGRLLVQRKSGDLEIWDERGGERRGTVAGDRGFVYRPASNGSLVARTRDDGTIVVADLDTGAVLGPLPATLSGGRVGVAFSGDGIRLVTVTEGAGTGLGRAVHRDISDETMVRTACATAGRDLRADEWNMLVGEPVPEDLMCR